jgi:hypothetical protein
MVDIVLKLPSGVLQAVPIPAPPKAPRAEVKVQVLRFLKFLPPTPDLNSCTLAPSHSVIMPPKKQVPKGPSPKGPSFDEIIQSGKLSSPS